MLDNISVDNNYVQSKTEENLSIIIDSILGSAIGGDHFFRSDTGTGKSRRLLNILLKMSDKRFAIAVPDSALAQQTYEHAQKILGEENVGVWTQRHEKGDFGAYEGRKAASSKRIFIGTHAFLMGDYDPKTHISDRDILIIDEIPKEVITSTLYASEFKKAYEKALECELGSLTFFQKADEWASSVLNSAANENKEKYEVAKDFPSFDFEDAIREIEALQKADQKHLQPVLGFAMAVQNDCSFIRVSRINGGVIVYFVSFKKVNKWFPKRLILSATPHLDGYQFSTHKKEVEKVHGFSVNYENLQVYEVPPPELPYSPKLIAQSDEQKNTAIEHISEIIERVKSTKILIVVPDALEEIFQNGVRVPDFKDISFTHWGSDVGSNDYRECSDVILWHPIVYPAHEYISRIHVYSGKDVTSDTLSEFTKNGNITLGMANDLRGDKIYSEIKQMGSRGKIREVQSNGGCSPMTLWVCWDQLDSLRLSKLFPNCKYDRINDFPEHLIKGETSHLGKLQKALNEIDDDVVTFNELSDRMNLSLKTLQNNASIYRQEVERLTQWGWSFEEGRKGPKGYPARFVRIAQSQSSLSRGRSSIKLL